jgi:hypothetical protein
MSLPKTGGSGDVKGYMIERYLFQKPNDHHPSTPSFTTDRGGHTHLWTASQAKAAEATKRPSESRPVLHLQPTYSHLRRGHVS